MNTLEAEYKYIVRDIFSHHNVRKMSGYIQHGNVTCLDHSIRVSYRSYRVCKFLKLDYKSAARGGLLHDYFLYDWHKSPYRLHGFTHPRRALNNANRDFNLNIKEQDIIRKHMWPLTAIPPMCIEAFVVCMVDKYCSTIEVFKSVDEDLSFVDVMPEEVEPAA